MQTHTYTCTPTHAFRHANTHARTHTHAHTHACTLCLLQEELEACDKYQQQLEDALDAKTAELIALRKVRGRVQVQGHFMGWLFEEQRAAHDVQGRRELTALHNLHRVSPVVCVLVCTTVMCGQRARP